jgi:hypothetical protein
MTKANEDAQEIVRSFLETLARLSGVSNSILFKRHGSNAIAYPKASVFCEGVNFANCQAFQSRRDLIILDLPLGLKGRETIRIADLSVTGQTTWVDIADALEQLSDRGFCIAMVEPLAFSSANGIGERFVSALTSAGFFLSGLIGMPQVYGPSTIKPVLAVFSRRETNNTFFGELMGIDQAGALANAFVERTDNLSLEGGLLRATHVFRGMEPLKAELELERLKTQYKEYQTTTLADLAEEIVLPKSGTMLEARRNAIYIAKIGTSPVVSDLADVTIKHQNIFQVVLSDRVSSDYVAAFFQSEIGKKVLSTLTTGSYVPTISKTELGKALVAVPPYEEQAQIVSTKKLLEQIKEALKGLQNELAVNPKNASAIYPQAVEILGQMGTLSEADRIKNIIRQGETKHSELKESLSLDVRKGTKEKYIEESALKTVVAFLNTDGGQLLVGVSDAGELTGLEAELEKFHKSSKDKFLLHFKNLLERRVGPSFYPYIDQKLVQADGVTILVVDCKRSERPCYLDGEKFFVRTNPATDKLEGPKLVEYVQNHFKTI